MRFRRLKSPVPAGRRLLPVPALILLPLLACVPGVLLADALSALSPRWQGQLVPVPETDVSGAEPLMQQGLSAARAEVAALLAEPEADSDALAAAYGRLGALLLLLEVEAPADACLRNAMALQPDAFRWPYYAGYLAMLAGNLEQALAYLHTAQAIDAEYAPLYLRLGKVRLDRSELEQARAAFERVRDVPALLAPAHYYLGQIALLERRHADAVDLLQTALAAHPDATEVHYPLAQAYRALGQADLARDHLAQFELRAPDIADPLLAELQAANRRALPAFKRAVHAVRGGDYAGAAEEFEAGLAVDPDNAAARISHARVLYLTGRPEAAAAELDAALQRDPEQALGHFLQGVLAQQRGATHDAAAAYERALALAPDHAGALFQRANLDFSAGRYAQAAAAYGRLIELDAAVAPARVLALVAARRAGAAEATVLAKLQSLATAHPEDPQAGYALARGLAAAEQTDLRDIDRALRLAAELALTRPGPAHQQLLAFVQAAAGRWDSAVETQQRLLAMAGWARRPAAEIEAMQQALTAYREHRLPGPAWPVDDPLLSPPPFDAARLFREYPATKPY
ncbi:tetratricopeptide repeat protein [Thiohalocapsa marina]|uniref:Tetratricopeptide repeat protein n=1 Tax=Thiohalocapsa marina TaxID=424902 RepID=A0A5M8FJH3_9GAMM|nr:tetratricopeptide repeat protein [Thiohalocapsa marina]KAA6184837.1 tetratricopeptide repeat protein [Thiohalocapsa marina]